MLSYLTAYLFYFDGETALAVCVLRATAEKKVVNFFEEKSASAVTWLEDFLTSKCKKSKVVSLFRSDKRKPYTTLSHNELSRRTAKIYLYCHTGQQQPGIAQKAARNRRRQGAANIRSGGPIPRKHTPDGAIWHAYGNQACIYRPRRDERLSWPNWLTYSGRFTHIVVTRRLQAERRTGSVCRPKTGVLPTVLRNQLDLAPLLRWHRHCVFTAVEHQVAINM